jgi:outer membrane protein assembly factor BamE (lipoprotein component of BamABCDE complex)|tara:strand:+ start:109 stop:504 length:396 start_codon:yes stop_codon:yes gene_type:complete
MQRIILFISLTLLLAGCVTAPEPLTKKNSELTQGMVQMKLEVGSTSKTEVLETFGAPNITTRDGKGDEVWTYQRQAQATQSSSQDGYWTIIFAGKSSSASGFETSSRMITLIIKFDNKDIVTDFKSRESNF